MTGATGFIGSAIVPELIKAGHQVLGLTRSDAGAKSLIAAGAEVHRGISKTWRACARERPSDGVIHTAFIHDFSKFKENCEIDKRAIEAMGAVLAGSDRPFIVTSGTAMAGCMLGSVATEDDVPLPPNYAIPRIASEEAAAAVAARGVQRVGRAPSAGSRHGQARARHLRDRNGSREGCVGVCGRRAQPLAGGARARCCPSLPARVREDEAREPDIMRSPKKAYRCETSPKSSAAA